MISFHSGTQRLAVGSEKGIVIIYDLRTATRASLIEQGSSVTAVSISKEGKLVATYSIKENCVRIFEYNSGIMGALAGAFGQGKSGRLGEGGQMRLFREFKVGKEGVEATKEKVLECVGFEWVGERKVMVKGVDGLEFVFTV